MIGWLREDMVRAFHLDQLAQHGGMAGVRSSELLESALARPQNLAAYGSPTLADLAASYAFGLAKNHPFIDGNKRVAFASAGAFLAMNGYTLTVPQAEAAAKILALAAGEIDEADLAAWIDSNLTPRPPR
ncbi:MAG: type II toxin-antitoxin system death-on-curing family toxin [Bryobacteraceae bacterium]|nr:type II toxin-antitoxin system death-on-curing family toxin [Bryobacteraceae bacterium]